MFNTLNHNQQQEVNAIVKAMGLDIIQSLRKITEMFKCVVNTAFDFSMNDCW